MTLRELRFRHNLTQEELAAITSVTQQYISRVEGGLTRVSPEYAEKLRQNFKLTLEQAWDMTQQGPEPKDRMGRRGPYCGGKRT